MWPPPAAAAAAAAFFREDGRKQLHTGPECRRPETAARSPPFPNGSCRPATEDPYAGPSPRRNTAAEPKHRLFSSAGAAADARSSAGAAAGSSEPIYRAEQGGMRRTGRPLAVTSCSRARRAAESGQHQPTPGHASQPEPRPSPSVRV